MTPATTNPESEAYTVVIDGSDPSTARVLDADGEVVEGANVIVFPFNMGTVHAVKLDGLKIQAVGDISYMAADSGEIVHSEIAVDMNSDVDEGGVDVHNTQTGPVTNVRVFAFAVAWGIGAPVEFKMTKITAKLAGDFILTPSEEPE